MKLIIEIPEETVKKIKDNAMFAPSIDSDIKWDITNAIVNSEEQPTGEWIMNKTSARGRNYTCTHCNKVSRNKFAYCPKCGVKMNTTNNQNTESEETKKEAENE